MPGTFRIGKIAGIDIDIHVSWIIILVLLTVSLATGWFPQLYPGWSTATYWLTSFIASLLLFVSVLLHELARSLVARRRGLPVKSITLFILLGIWLFFKRWNDALLLLALGVPGGDEHWLLLLTVGAMIVSGPGMFLAGVISLLGTRRFLRQAAYAKGRVSDIQKIWYYTRRSHMKYGSLCSPQLW